MSYIIFKSTYGFLSQARKSRCSSNIKYEILNKLKYGINTITALLTPYIQLHSVFLLFRVHVYSAVDTLNTRQQQLHVVYVCMIMQV